MQLAVPLDFAWTTINHTNSEAHPAIAYGYDLAPCRVASAGIDLFITSGDTNLIQLPSHLPPVLPGEQPLLRVSGLVPVMDEGRIKYAHLLRPMMLIDLLGAADTPLSNNWKKLGVVASNELADPRWELLSAKSPLSLPHDRLLDVDPSSTREAVWKIPGSQASATTIWSLPAPVTLGDESNYLGNGESEGASHIEKFELKTWPPAAPGVVEARIVVFGIGPENKNGKKETPLMINGNQYGMLRFSPFKGLSRTQRWKSRYLVPLRSDDLKSGLNQIEIRAGEDPQPDGRIGLDDVIIQELDLFFIQGVQEAQPKEDLG